MVLSDVCSIYTVELMNWKCQMAAIWKYFTINESRQSKLQAVLCENIKQFHAT